MWQFLQTYGVWIVFGIFFLLMMRMHLGGMHGGGGGMDMDRSKEPSHDHSPSTQRAIPLDNNQHGTVVRDITPEGEVAATESPARRRHSSC